MKPEKDNKTPIGLKVLLGLLVLGGGISLIIGMFLLGPAFGFWALGGILLFLAYALESGTR